MQPAVRFLILVGAGFLCVEPGIARADAAFSPMPPHEYALQALVLATAFAFVSAAIAALALRLLRAALTRNGSSQVPAAPKKSRFFLVALLVSLAVWFPLLYFLTVQSVEEQSRNFDERQRRKMENLRRGSDEFRRQDQEIKTRYLDKSP